MHKTFEIHVDKEVNWKGRDYRNRVSKKDIENWLFYLGIDFKSSMKKEDIYKLLRKRVTALQVYERFKNKSLGINSYEYEKRFNISRKVRLEMIEKNFIKIRYYHYIATERMETRVPFADAIQFYSMTQREINEFIDENKMED